MAEPLERLHSRASVFSRIAQHLSPNRSSRHGAKVLGAVVHTTESGDDSFDGIVNYLSREGVSASAHYVVGAHPALGEEFTRVTMLVPEAEKAWTALSANPYFVQYELIGRARRSRQEWLVQYRAQMETLAALVADDVLQYGFPVRHAVPGIVGHVDLSRYGFPQTHTDPGPGFPWDVFIRDVEEFVALADSVPDVVTVPAAIKGRPGNAPRVIPLWAWRLMKWHDSGRQGPRPNAPAVVPEWYWLWRSWRLGLRQH